MKPKKTIIKVNIPAKIDAGLIIEAKLVAEDAGFRYFCDWVDAAFRGAIRETKKAQRRARK